MKRIIIYVGILAALLAAPVEPLNVGELLPVKVISIYKEGNWFVVETDTENRGMGGTVQQALKNLKDTASGVIYLDTAEYLLLTKDTIDAAEELKPVLRNSVRLCLAAKPVNLAEAAKYLTVHADLPKLQQWKTGEELPVLSTFGESLIFLKKVEKRA